VPFVAYHAYSGGVRRGADPAKQLLRIE